ncbi:hypothetical protein V491_07258 [Pseudogymnoascus sp. VKM F-3775]|nr:hypothetical protein V491_07258 [Pseudogymnoascus sp. VKM F-3775]
MDNAVVDKAIAAIKTADLTPTEHLILRDFVKEAYEPSLAARVVLDRISDDGRPVEETLRVLKEDWHGLVGIISCPAPFDAHLKDLVGRRDQFRYRVTPATHQQLDAPEPTFTIPPTLSQLVGDKESKHPSKSLLDAFMTPSRAARLLSMVARSWDDFDENAGQGELKSRYFIMPIYPEKDGRSKATPSPKPLSPRTHCKFANALHQFYVEDRIAEGWGPLQSPSFFSRNTQRIARAIWLLVPKFIRVACYHYLLEKGKPKYGFDISEVVQQLPFGLYAKCNHTHSNEANALRLLEREAPSIPAPLLIDTFCHNSYDWFISTRVPGTRAHGLLHRTSYPERDQLAADLSHFIAQMQKIPNTTPYRFANITGGPIYDRRIDSPGAGPNVLIDGGRLSGIVDWESAAFMPTYWECAKAMRTARSEEAKEIYEKIWGDKFEVELEPERWIWNAFPFLG